MNGVDISALALITVLAVDPMAAQPVDTISRRGADSPFFVSLAAAVGPEGQIRWEVFGPPARRQLELAMQHPARAETTKPCPVRTVTPGGPTRPYRTWPELTTNASAIIRGKIVASTPGFEFARPVTILEIGVSETIARQPGFPELRVVRVMNGEADFDIGGVRFCSAGPIAGFTPGVGDDVIVFAYEPPIDAAGTFILTAPEQLVFGRRNRVFSVVKPATSTDAATFEDVWSATR